MAAIMAKLGSGWSSKLLVSLELWLSHNVCSLIHQLHPGKMEAYSLYTVSHLWHSPSQGKWNSVQSISTSGQSPPCCCWVENFQLSANKPESLFSARSCGNSFISASTDLILYFKCNHNPAQQIFFSFFSFFPWNSMPENIPCLFSC